MLLLNQGVHIHAQIECIDETDEIGMVASYRYERPVKAISLWSSSQSCLKILLAGC
jgi:hypothetical protein